MHFYQILPQTAVFVHCETDLNYKRFSRCTIIPTSFLLTFHCRPVLSSNLQFYSEKFHYLMQSIEVVKYSFRELRVATNLKNFFYD